MRRRIALDHRQFQQELDALIASARLQHDTAGMLLGRVMSAIEAKAAADASFISTFGHLMPSAIASYAHNHMGLSEDEAMMAWINTLRDAVGVWQ